jgi:DNA repair protein RadD
VWRNDGLVVNTSGAEFTEESIERVLLEQEVIARIPGIVKESIEKGRKHRIVFVSSVADAEYLATIVPNSKAVSALTKPQERADILTRFKAGEIQTVFNVGVLTIGFDFPALDTIIIARPTMSLSLYMQMIGRGIRLSEGKVDCAVVDMCGNYNRFGEIETIEYKQLPYGQKLWVLMNKGQVLSNVKLKP